MPALRSFEFVAPLNAVTHSTTEFHPMTELLRAKRRKSASGGSTAGPDAPSLAVRASLAPATAPALSTKTARSEDPVEDLCPPSSPGSSPKKAIAKTECSAPIEEEIVVTCETTAIAPLAAAPRQQSSAPLTRRVIAAPDSAVVARIKQFGARELERRQLQEVAKRSHADILREERARARAVRKADLERKRLELYAWNRRLRADLESQQLDTAQLNAV